MGSRFIPTVDELRRRLRRAGLRTTTARLAVMRVLAAAPEPLSQGELVRAVADELFDRATIYRNLVDLSRVGLVARAGQRGRAWRFELRRPGTLAAPSAGGLCARCEPSPTTPVVSLGEVPLQVTSRPPARPSPETAPPQPARRGRCASA